METRKRKSALENYIDKLTDPPEKQRKVSEFYNSLRVFYKRRWNAPLKLPHIQGVEVNLYRLYDTVMAYGGWQKVAHNEKWSDIAEMFGVKDDIACGDHAIKLVYMRYLSKFEQVETIGDVDDYVDNEMSRSRGRNATSFFATNECPISTAKLQGEFIPRDERGNIINDPDYCRLTKSLLSGLPNEIDFAMNICMLLSHAGPKQLRISHAPTLMSLLVAHTGIFDESDPTITELGKEWNTSTSHDFESFWASSGVAPDVLKILASDKISKMAVEASDEFFSGLTSTYNVKDPRAWRLNQVTTIIRNLSFEPANRVTIVNTWPVMKFLILCASCKWAPLYTAGYDALSNLASDINLTSRTMVHVAQHAILRLIQEGIFSMDKFKLMRSLEMLTGLCAFEGNETIVVDWLKPDVIRHIFEIVGVRDIMLCVYTLECLYQISEMGDTSCDLIADSPKAIQQLVAMATLEAVSFGPAGLTGMKVVEYQPQNPNPSNTQTSQQYMNRVPQNQHTAVQSQSQPMTVRQVIQNSLAMQSQQVTSNNLSNQHHQLNIQNGTKLETKPLLTSRQIVPRHNHGGSKLEQLTEQWIKQKCLFEPMMATPRGELYAAYVEDLRNHYHSMSGSLAMFSGVIKNLYPDVNFQMDSNNAMIVAQGIRLVRSHNPSPSKALINSVETHPLMKKMLSETETTGQAPKDSEIKTTSVKENEKDSSEENENTIEKRETIEGTTNGNLSSTTPTNLDDKNIKHLNTNSETDYMCDWDCCSHYFSSPGHVLKHLSEEHVVEELLLLCRWNGCSDPTARNRWSLITHIQDSHCSESQLKAAAQKKLSAGSSLVQSSRRVDIAPRETSINHPGYSRNAAFEAIKRHAFNFLPRDLTDEAEGPVTKSIRLTSSLILRNLARYSAEGRQKLRRHESHLCWLALSKLESGHALSQLLSELQQAPITMEELKAIPSVPSTTSLTSIIADAGKAVDSLSLDNSISLLDNGFTAKEIQSPSVNISPGSLAEPSQNLPCSKTKNVKMSNYSTLNTLTQTAAVFAAAD